MGSKRKEIKRGKTDLNVMCNIGQVVLFLFVSVYLRQDYLSATLQINPSVLAVSFKGSDIQISQFLKTFSYSILKALKHYINL